MKKFDVSEYKGHYGMHCLDKESAEIFMRHLDTLGRCWQSGRRYTEADNWNGYTVDTVYYFNEGTYGTIKLSSKDSTLEFYDFDWGEEQDEDDIGESNLYSMEDLL